MSILKGAEPFAADGGPIGVLVLHGFTGSPQSMRPWAEYLAEAGLTVRLPLLPGHGRTWQEMNKTSWHDWYGTVRDELAQLRERCSTVFVMGLSMGGALALRLAEEYPDIAGLVLVNPAIISADRRLKLLPVLRRVVSSVRGIGSDIKKDGVQELAYTRVPLQALTSMHRAWPVVLADLERITCPVLVYRSETDHVVEPLSCELLAARIRNRYTEHVLTDSYHVATLDNDAPTIFAGSLEFVRANSRRSAAAQDT
jgi:carboxylesterase